MTTPARFETRRMMVVKHANLGRFDLNPVFASIYVAGQAMYIDSGSEMLYINDLLQTTQALVLSCRKEKKSSKLLTRCFDFDMHRMV